MIVAILRLSRAAVGPCDDPGPSPAPSCSADHGLDRPLSGGRVDGLGFRRPFLGPSHRGGGAEPHGGRRRISAPFLAGIEVRLDPHFITYWRDPGDAGVPPSFDVAASTNLKSADVRYPAPERLDEAGAEAYGYSHDVVFPLRVTPLDPAKPVTLAVEFEYAVCYNICLPARAELRLTLDGRPSAEGDRVLAALAAVPRRARLGADGPLPRILTVRPDPGESAGERYTVEAVADEDSGTLFVEAPEGWAFEAGAPVHSHRARCLPMRRPAARSGSCFP